MIPDPCCLGCKGATPYFMCKNPLALSWLNTLEGCACHKAQDKKATKSRGRPLYRDPTFDAVLSRNSQEKSKP